MNILYDTLSCDLIGNGGTTRYPVELYKNVPNYADVKVSCCITNNQYMLDLGYPSVNYLQLNNIPNNYTSIVNSNYCANLLVSGNYDIYHPTDNNDILLKYKPKNTKLVYTVHDCLPEIYNMPANFFAPGTFDMKRNLIEHADGIICVSNQTKTDLFKYYNIKDNQQVTVIYNGKPTYIYNILPRLIENDYILYVGGREIGPVCHKRFLTLIKEFSIYHKLNPNVKLVCVGAPFNNNELYTIKMYGLTINDNIVTCSATDKQLVSLYQHAMAFVSSAEYEGFGLTPLEAMIYNPMILLNQNNPTFKEIYKNSVIWFDLDNEGDFANKLYYAKITDTLKHNQQLVLNSFSWDNTAQETVEFYSKILNDNI